MAEIKPFKGVLYNEEKTGDLKKVMAPPYDVISGKFQDELYSRHPNNIIRLILGKEFPTDTPGNDRYSRAASEISRWIDEGVVAADAKPAIYYYVQVYKLKDGTSRTRKGFIALSKIEDFGKGGIHPHEKTLSGPKADRLKLMQACKGNFSCIFSLYSEKGLGINKALDKAVEGKRPLIDVIDDDRIENELWRVEDPSIIEKVVEGMKGKALFIADGHHRYETALNYRNMMRQETGSKTGTEPFDYVLMYFSNMEDEGMTIWPTHRIVHSLKGFDPDAFLSECKKYFDIEEFQYVPKTEHEVRRSFLKRLNAASSTNAFGLHLRARDVYYVLTIKSKDVMDKVFGTSIPEVFKNLDVTVLHSLIFSRILGITQEAQEKQENLIYVKSYDEAISAASTDKNQLVFLLNPTRIEQVRAVAEAGFVMPQKSTYFYPKLLSGLVINLHETMQVKKKAPV